MNELCNIQKFRIKRVMGIQKQKNVSELNNFNLVVNKKKMYIFSNICKSVLKSNPLYKIFSNYILDVCNMFHWLNII